MFMMIDGYVFCWISAVRRVNHLYPSQPRKPRAGRRRSSIGDALVDEEEEEEERTVNIEVVEKMMEEMKSLQQTERKLKTERGRAEKCLIEARKRILELEAAVSNHEPRRKELKEEASM
jgi:hypothetical protein